MASIHSSGYVKPSQLTGQTSSAVEAQPPIPASLLYERTYCHPYWQPIPKPVGSSRRASLLPNDSVERPNESLCVLTHRWRPYQLPIPPTDCTHQVDRLQQPTAMPFPCAKIAIQIEIIMQIVSIVYKRYRTRVRESMLAWWIATSDWTSSVKPLRAAKWMGVSPQRDLLLTNALCSSKVLQTAPWPFSLAKCKADIPSESNTSTRA